MKGYGRVAKFIRLDAFGIGLWEVVEWIICGAKWTW